MRGETDRVRSEARPVLWRHKGFRLCCLSWPPTTRYPELFSTDGKNLPFFNPTVSTSPSVWSNPVVYSLGYWFLLTANTWFQIEYWRLSTTKVVTRCGDSSVEKQWRLGRNRTIRRKYVGYRCGRARRSPLAYPHSAPFHIRLFLISTCTLFPSFPTSISILTHHFNLY